MNIYKNAEKVVSILKQRLKSSDIQFLEIPLKNQKAFLVFLTNIADKDLLGKFVIKPLTEAKEKLSKKNLEKILISPEKQVVNTIEDLTEKIVSGNSALILDGLSISFVFGLKKFNKRSISEPPTSTVIKGPREGFVENLSDNLCMIRRRIKSKDLIIDSFTVGEYSLSDVSFVYVKGICDQKLVESLKEKVKKIKIDALLDSSYITKFLSSKRASLFKQVGNTEKPDVLSSKILEGRVAILVDGSPIALTVPYLLIEDFQSPSDYYNSPYSASASRIIRLISVLISLLLPAFYVSAELFHLQLIPLSFLITIENSIKGIPLSPSYEMFFTLLIFEVLNEASVRMPKYVGMVVSIVGALVLGETAVTAGIISAPTLMIVALSGICLYTVPELEQSLSILRLIFLIVAGSLGGYALIIAICFCLIYLISFENYGTPIFAPYSPLIKEDLKDGIIKNFMTESKFTPLSISKTKKLRVGNDK